ncbi:FAD-binding and (Fe-S)-binding domain-containing protein [Roseivivax halodurans]|uniref:FAD-binding and (Fe-S)-binding domain-containing protein n=1 Tax=Roseivivax halodurans TaxID=93683 RepID=UPI0004AC5C84|nr:FAD-binding and (Fe-S)-binding domain-containing protein [Roseivivax halodurans]
MARFRADLAVSEFAGGVRFDPGSRIATATDNSIYHVPPAGVLEPRDADDLALAMTIAARHGIAVTPRGGGTGTNGQSLTGGMVLDTSRHMTAIGPLDAERGTVRVGPGVVLDRLNTWLRPHGWMFAPSVSTASRATIGGMVATDASGKGSCRHGRTSDHLLSVDVVLADGRHATLRDIDANEVAAAIAEGGPLAAVLSCLDDGLPDRQEEIARTFPDMNRGLTGYNLRDTAHKDGGLRLTKLFAGSEGTLAVAASIELSLTRLPRHRGVALLAYDDCDRALQAVPGLLPADPEAVEFLDDTVVQMGRSTPAWVDLEAFIGSLSEMGGYLFAEVCGDSRAEVGGHLDRLVAHAGEQPACRGCAVSSDPGVVAAMSRFRQDAVGLLSRGVDGRQGTAFVEDAAVPPASLVDFVREFRAILDAEGLSYGMFGHADAGCVHVRPMLDMTRAEDRSLIRPISDAVADLALRHGGLIWGEHGKGVRGEYLEAYFGAGLHLYLRQIKSAFDPEGRLNPGKLVVPLGGAGRVGRIDEVPFRGVRDAEISDDAAPAFRGAIRCNGNGGCFHWDASVEMCPSYKATGDRMQSPKGRAALIREWLYQTETNSNPEAAESVGKELYQSLSTCLSCKACSSQCPVRIDIPSMKAQFLDKWHRHQPRPRRDLLIQALEPATILAAHFPSVSRQVMRFGAARKIFEKTFGVTDLPAFPRQPLSAAMRDAGALPLRSEADVAPNEVILLSDSFLGVFEPEVLAAAAQCLKFLTDKVYFTPPLKNGKALEVRGLLNRVPEIRAALVAKLQDWSQTGAKLVSIEPAFTMLLRQEMAVETRGLEILSIEEILNTHRDRLPIARMTTQFRMVGHCTETSAIPEHLARWRAVFEAAGLELDPVRSGCCGMAGLWGHEAEHRNLSRQIYGLAWQDHVEAEHSEFLATGFSCRSQARRFSGKRLRHPVQVLASELTENNYLG